MATATVCLFFLACALLGADALHVIPRAAEDDNTMESPDSCTRQASIGLMECYNSDDWQYFWEATLVNLTESDELDKRCQSHDTGKDCMKPFLEDCGNDNPIEDLVKGPGYVCGEGRKALLEMASCKKLGRVDRRIEKCRHKAAVRTAALLSDPANKPKVCGVLNRMIKCVTRGARRRCRNHKAAAEFVNAKYTLFLAPTKEAFGCDKDDEGTGTASKPPKERDVQLLEATMDELPSLQGPDAPEARWPF